MKKILTIVASFAMLSATADTVKMKGGSILHGTVKKIHENTLYMSTEFSSEISIDLKKVISFQTDKEHQLKLKDGQKLLGKIDYSEKAITITNDSSKTEVKGNSVNMLWAPETNAPDYKPPFVRKWNSSLAADFSVTEGNTQEKNFTLVAETFLEGEKDTLKFYARFHRSAKEGDDNAKEYIGGTDYEYRFSDKQSWYVRGELEDDEFEGIDLRTTAAAGYGHYFYKEPELSLRGRIGALYRHESFDDGRNDSTMGIDTGLRLDWQIRKGIKWYTDITWAPSIEDFADYRFRHESAIALDLADTAWKLKLGVLNEYNSEPAEDKQKTDTTYFSRIEYSW